MAVISSTNSASGLDVRNLVDQLVAAEGGPISSRLDRKEVTIQSGLTGIGSFRGALLDFQTSLAPLRSADVFNAINTTSSDSEKFTVSAEDNAVIGDYEVEISQLAQSQKLKSQPFESELDNIGAGTIVIEFGAMNSTTNNFKVNASVPRKRIEIDENNSSLHAIQLAINEANSGVKASVINDGTGYRLILNVDKTGAENSLRISISDEDEDNSDLEGLSILAYDPTAIEDDEDDGYTEGKNLEVVAQARNAIFSIDGVSISNSENTIKNNIPGLTINLKKTTDESVETFKIEKDTAGIKQSIESFVSSYNELTTTVNTLTGFNSETRQAGPLSGDSTIRGVINQTRRLLSTSFNNINRHLTSLASIGINSSLSGTLNIDTFKLDKALTEYPSEISHLFSANVSSSDTRIKVVSNQVPPINDVVHMSVEEVPTRGFYVGEKLSSYPDEVGGVPRSFSLAVDGITTSELKIFPREFDSGYEFALELQQVINKDVHLQRNNISVTVEYINDALKITSDTVGSKSSVEIKSMSRYLYFLAGMPMGKGEKGSDLVAKVDGSTLTGEGNKITLGGTLKGIVLEVSGKNTGNRGDLTITNGIASTLDGLMQSFLADDGLIDARIDGYNSRVKSINKQRDNLVRKLEVSEQRYLKQFSNLDAMLGKMRSTSNFLADKLSNLPGAAKR